MAVLSGFSVAMIGARWWDHTYATSSDGHLWSCFGRDSGGLILDRGTGDSALADCLAHPIRHPHVYAGITYGLTGLCHQAANRILYPAGIKVARAKGYGGSVFAFGEYGLGPWREKDVCVKMAASSVAPPSEGGKSQMPSETAKQSPSLTPEEMERQEFQALADVSLGEGYDPVKLAQVGQLRLGLRSEQARLVRQLGNRHISRLQYLNLLNELLTRTYSECAKILGTQDFEKLFGTPLNEVVNMVDRDLFLARP
jgi:hypothetical protein